MTRDEIFAKVKDVLVDALAVDEEDVQPGASLFKDLGAESIDVLDIIFKLEQQFKIKIGQGELFPEDVMKDPRYVTGGKVTPLGIEELKRKLPHVDFAQLEKDPAVGKVFDILTVDALVRFVERKVSTAAAA
jgi:acyl carrier protein